MLERDSHRARTMDLRTTGARLVLGGVIALGALGCDRGGGAAFATGAVVGIAALSALSATDPPRPATVVYVHPPPAQSYGQTYGRPPSRTVIYFDAPASSDAAPVLGEPGTFDATATRVALGEVDVTPCGGPAGYGHAQVTMNPDGHISRVLIEDPEDLDPRTAQCIGRKLGQITVPPFRGSMVVVGTSFLMD